MTSQVVWSSTTPTADMTDERLGTRMFPMMELQRDKFNSQIEIKQSIAIIPYIPLHFVNEGLFAVVALVNAFRVLPHVRFQTSVEGKRFVALLALQRLLARVRSPVHLQRVCRRKDHPAPLTNERFALSVTFHVQIQLVLAHKLFLARFARELVLVHRYVPLFVDPETLEPIELLVAEFTLVLTSFAIVFNHMGLDEILCVGFFTNATIDAFL